MTLTEYILWWVAAAVGILGSAMCSGVELGCYSLNRVRLNLRATGAGNASKPDALASMLRAEVERPDRLLATILIGNNCFNFLGSLAITALLSRTGQPDGVIAAINTLVLTPILFIFGETLPKVIFRQEADRLTYPFAPIIRFMRILFTIVGIIPLLAWLTHAVQRALKLPQEELISDARQRMAALVREGASGSSVSESHATLIDRALAFGRISVDAEMVPWSKVTSYPADWDRARLLRVFARTPHSRVPLTDRQGRVVGVIRQIDLYINAKASPKQLMLTPARLTPEMTGHQALKLLRETQARIGIVESDGKPVGLVTTKDLVEPLTGELPDW
jgi:putative hemolysin